MQTSHCQLPSHCQRRLDDTSLSSPDSHVHGTAHHEWAATDALYTVYTHRPDPAGVAYTDFISVALTHLKSHFVPPCKQNVPMPNSTGQLLHNVHAPLFFYGGSATQS